MADDIYNDILWRLRIPLPYELRGLTVSDLMKERKDAADEIERLRAEVSRWRQLAITDHLDVCNLDDHELCLSYLEWKISQAVRGA